MYFTIFLDTPQPPPYPSIWLFLPRVDFHWGSAVSHDDLLFIAQICTGTEFCLMRLGELTWPDKLASRDYRKVHRWSSLQVETWSEFLAARA
jgi:hypothetical protein